MKNSLYYFIFISLLLSGCGNKVGILGLEKSNLSENPYAYYNGIDVPIDLQKAFNLASQQCQNNNLESCFLMAYMLSRGEGVLKDQKKADELYEKSCTGFEKETTHFTEQGSYKTKKLYQDSNACYFVAQKKFYKEDYIEAYKKYEIFQKKSKSPAIILDTTDKQSFRLKINVFQELPFDQLLVYREPFPLYLPFLKKVHEVILFENISANKTKNHKNILAYYDYRLEIYEKQKNNNPKYKREKAFLLKNKGVFLEALGKNQEALKTYQEGCLLSDTMSCILYKGLKTRGGNF